MRHVANERFVLCVSVVVSSSPATAACSRHVLLSIFLFASKAVGSGASADGRDNLRYGSFVRSREFPARW